MSTERSDPESGNGASVDRPATPLPASEINLWVSGDPKGKDRPKFNRKTGVAYTPKGTFSAEADIRSVWRDAGEPRMPDDVALGIEVLIYVSRPGGHFKSNGELSTQGVRQPRPLTRKPDVDNVIKLIMDSLNKRAYRDDVRICEVHIERHWADWPATSIRIYPLAT